MLLEMQMVAWTMKVVLATRNQTMKKSRNTLSYRRKLKTRLQTDFGEDITFLSPKNKTLTEVVISSEYLNAEMLQTLQRY